ncbi:hypothetical protein [Rhodopila sp.]|uniref:hypothetical protein n=1 Tax=Rhodopila sp. TaxID=2480087 RepID=UPI003D0DB066
MTLDLTPIVQPILVGLGTIITGLLAIYVPKILTALQARAGIALTDQQRAVVTGAVQTAAGILETDLDKGVLQRAHINVSNQAVLDQARAVIAAVPAAATAMGLTPDGAARMIVGAVDTAAHGVVAAPVKAPIALAVVEKSGTADVLQIS